MKIGDQFNYWKVIELTSKAQALCQCTACNNTTKLVYKTDIKLGNSKSCGCMRAKYVEETCFQKYGVKSSTLDPNVKAKKLDSLQKKYGNGIVNSFQASEVKEKAKKTNLEKYGTEFACQSTEVKARREKTNLERYGTKNPSSLPEIRQKVLETNIKLYGTAHPAKLPVFQEKAKESNLQRYGAASHSQLPENRNKLKAWCESNPGYNGQSKSELELLEWVKTYYSSATKIKQQGHELDIYIPELKLGIEYNGLFWHSEINKSKTYHLNKTKYFQSQGIRVIHIWEHEWLQKQTQVKSFLLSALEKNQHKIGARKCHIIWSSAPSEIEKAHNLLNATHIQGHTNSTRYAANVYYKDELVATATFGLHHRNSQEWVLSRFTTKTNFTIQGILSRVTKLAVQNLKTPIISWANYRLSTGNGYEKAGWVVSKKLPPDYFYFKGTKVISKQSRQKNKIKTPVGMTEAQHAEQDGLLRVWDCGKIKYVFNQQEEEEVRDLFDSL